MPLPNQFFQVGLELKLRSSCLHRKHFTNWVISLAFNWQIVWIIEVLLLLVKRNDYYTPYKLGKWDLEQVGNLSKLFQMHKLKN